MKFRQVINILTLLAIIPLLAGCSGSPTSPDPMQNSPQVTSNVQSDFGIHANLGSYMIQINKNDQTVEALPLRTSDLHLNLTKIFVKTMGLSLQYIPAESNPALGEFTIDFTLTHPFDNHPEYTAFDVKGIILSPGTVAVSNVVFSGPDETRLSNADGYSRWWNPTEFTQPGIFGYSEGLFTNTTASNLTASVNPYKYFADSLGSTDDLAPLHAEPLDGDMGRGLFSPGESNTRKYYLVFPLNPTPVIVFGYVIDGCWDVPTPNPPTDVPENFPMTANQAEAYDMELEPGLVELYYDTESSTGGGLCNLDVKVYDWQGENAGNINGEISSVKFFSPDLFTGSVAATYVGETSEAATYFVDLTGTAVPSYAGSVPIYVRVISNGSPNYNQGFSYQAPDEAVAAWDVFFLAVEEVDCFADANNDFGEAVDLDTENNTIDQMCTPSDYKDFYKFDLPQCEVISGSLTLYCDAEPTTMGLYDSTQALITEENVSGGTAVLDFTPLDLSAGMYYVRLLTSAPQAFKYMLEPDMIFSEPTAPIDPEDVTPPGLNLNGGDLFSHGNYLYVAGDGLRIIDYTDPSNPVCINFVDIDYDYVGDLNYPYFYYATEVDTSSFLAGIVDISDPLNPVLYPDVLWFPTNILAINGDGDHLYVGLMGALHSMVRIFDVSSGIDAPVIIHEFLSNADPKKFCFVNEEPGPGRWLVVSSFSYYKEFLDITDMSSLGDPVVIDVSPDYFDSDIAVKDNYVFTITNQPPNRSLTSIKLEPSGPVVKGSASYTWGAMYLDVEENYAFIGSSSDMKFVVVDITDPDAPINPVAYDCGYFGLGDLETSGNNLFISCLAAGIETWSIQNPSSPALIGRSYGISYLQDFALNNNYIYVVENMVGYLTLKIVDIADPSDINVAKELILTKSCNKVCAYGDRLVGGSWDDFLELVDIADPLNPSTVNTVNNGTNISSLAMNGAALYVGNELTNNINVWGLGTWPAIAVSSVVPLPDMPVDILLNGDYMYVTAGSGIEIFSISNPALPSYIATYTPIASPPKFLNIHGDVLLITSNDTFEMADISNPGSPAFISSLSIPVDPQGWQADSDDYYAFLQGVSNSQTYVIGICPIDTLEMIGPVPDWKYLGDGCGVIENDGYVYEGWHTFLNIFKTGY